VKEGLNDKILNKVLKMSDRITDRIAIETKGQKPFASVEMHAEDLIWASDNLGYEDMTDLINEFGYDAVNRQLFEINKLKKRRGLDKTQ